MELLTIGDLAARSGVAPSALRFYEREGLLSYEGGQITLKEPDNLREDLD